MVSLVFALWQVAALPRQGPGTGLDKGESRDGESSYRGRMGSWFIGSSVSSQVVGLVFVPEPWTQRHTCT